MVLSHHMYMLAFAELRFKPFLGTMLTHCLQENSMHAAYNNGCEVHGNEARSSVMPMLATTCWPMVMPDPAQPPATMEDLASMLLINNDSMSIGMVPLPVRQDTSQPPCLSSHSATSHNAAPCIGPTSNSLLKEKLKDLASNQSLVRSASSGITQPDNLYDNGMMRCLQELRQA